MTALRDGLGAAPGPVDVSIVIPTFDRCASLLRALDALERQDTVAGYEVIVVSDGCTDGTLEALARRQVAPTAGLAVVDQPNLGPAAARNAGIDRARGELVLFVDDDIVASPDLVRAHVHAHRAAGPRAAVIGPMLTPTAVQLSPWVAWQQDKLEQQYRGMQRGDWAPTFRQFYTGNASVPRRLLTEVGGFDVRLRRGEDVELGFRLHQAGTRFAFCPEARAEHHAERSYESWLGAAEAYGRHDLEFDRERFADVLPSLADEFAGRNAASRALLLTSLRAPRLGEALTWPLGRIARWSGPGSRTRLTHAVRSGVYHRAYSLSMARALGGNAALRELLRPGAATPDRRPLVDHDPGGRA